MVKRTLLPGLFPNDGSESAESADDDSSDQGDIDELEISRSNPPKHLYIIASLPTSILYVSRQVSL